MNNSINLKEISQILNLNEDSANIYVTLLTHGKLPLNELEILLNISESTLKNSLQELVEKGFIQNFTDGSDQETFQVLTPLQIEERLSRQKNVLKKLKKFINTKVQPAEKLGILKYEGWEGIRRVYLEVLEEAIKTKEPILAIENIPDKDDSQIGQIFLENYLNSRLENKITAKVITSDSPASKEYKEKNDNRLTETKIYKDLKLQGTINIVGNLVMSYSTSPAQGTLRKDPIEAFNLKQMFHLVWNSNNSI